MPLIRFDGPLFIGVKCANFQLKSSPSRRRELSELDTSVIYMCKFTSFLPLIFFFGALHGSFFSFFSPGPGFPRFCEVSNRSRVSLSVSDQKNGMTNSRKSIRCKTRVFLLLCCELFPIASLPSPSSLFVYFHFHVTIQHQSSVS